MKNLEITKHQLVKNTDKEFLELGIIYFQLVTFKLNFYGNHIESTLDTRIMKDGRQIVIDGNGWIDKGYELN